MENRKTDGVLIFDEIAVMRNRMSSLLQEYNIPVNLAPTILLAYRVQ